MFGATRYAYQGHGSKLDARSVKGIFLGYDGESPAYLVHLPEKDTVKKESVMWRGRMM